MNDDQWQSKRSQFLKDAATTAATADDVAIVGRPRGVVTRETSVPPRKQAVNDERAAVRPDDRLKGKRR